MNKFSKKNKKVLFSSLALPLSFGMIYSNSKVVNSIDFNADLTKEMIFQIIKELTDKIDIFWDEPPSDDLNPNDVISEIEAILKECLQKGLIKENEYAYFFENFKISYLMAYNRSKSGDSDIDEEYSNFTRVAQQLQNFLKVRSGLFPRDELVIGITLDENGEEIEAIVCRDKFEEDEENCLMQAEDDGATKSYFKY